MFSSYLDELFQIVNCSLQPTLIPSSWKIANVVFLRKNESLRYEVDNIRPVSLTANLVKIFEKILHVRLREFIFCQGIIYRQGK